MTKKDYELIASAIAFSKLYNYSITKTSYELASRLASKNPRFNKEKFLQACGVEVKQHTKYHKWCDACYENEG